MMNDVERKLLLSIIYENIRIEEVDSNEITQAIKSAMQEIDELKDIQRTEQGEVIIKDDEIVTDDEEYL